MAKKMLRILGLVIAPGVASLFGFGFVANAASCPYAYDLTENYNNPKYVTSLYQTILSREPDAPGLAYWVDLLDRCVSTRDQVLTEFIKTSNCVNYVKKLYQDDLHREADTEGLNYWVGTCVSGQSSFAAIGEYFKQYVPKPVLIISVNNSGQSIYTVTFAATVQGDVKYLVTDPVLPSLASVAATAQVEPRYVQYYGQFYDLSGRLVQCRKDFPSSPQSVVFTLDSSGTRCTAE